MKRKIKIVFLQYHHEKLLKILKILKTINRHYYIFKKIKQLFLREKQQNKIISQILRNTSFISLRKTKHLEVVLKIFY